ncbi:putative quinol monooxygenase [Marinicrinis sediminis]|uniref:Quinol monooxygenase n=1 Tax=Marinicrinis sediminis TaxID=1652465 RepID=A0ABW5R8W6_9BACL
MLLVMVRFKVKTDKREALLELAQKLVDNTVKEEGYVSYELTEISLASNEFMFVEKWASKETLDKHGSTDFFKEQSGHLAQLLDGEPQTEVYVLGDRLV